MTELHWTEVDQVPTVWTDAPLPSGAGQPTLWAGLLFRAGSADEALASLGQTHLIEHLTLSTLADPAQRHNGFVGPVVTGFFTMGQTQEVSSFLAGVCDALSALPGDRIDAQRQILAAESSQKPYDFRANLLTWRYGARGYGLPGMHEFGLREATIEQLRSRSARWFTKESAVLWLSGTPPADVRLNLPHGVRQPLPPLAPIQPTFPSWLTDDACGGVAAGATVPRVSASTVLARIALARLYDRLRTAQSVSYHPLVSYDHLDADTAHLVLYADSHRDHRAELASAFGEVFSGLGEVKESEVEAAQAWILERWTGALAPSPRDQILEDLQRAAFDWLYGRQSEPTEALVAEMLAVTAGDASKIGRDFQATAMFALPRGTEVQPWCGEEAPASTGPVVQGREILSADSPVGQDRLVYGPAGVSLLLPDGGHLTVRYAELAAALHYDDGCVSLIGCDAAQLTIEPTLWRDGQSVCRKIRESVPAHLLLAQGPRPADAIPRPTSTTWQRLRARLKRR